MNKKQRVETTSKTKEEHTNYPTEECIRKIRRKGILRLMGSHCWEGNLDELRKNRCAVSTTITTQKTTQKK